MLPVINLDPSALWMAFNGEETSKALTYIERSVEWLSVSRESVSTPYVCSAAVVALTSIGAFPAEPWFEGVIASVGLEGVVSSKTLAALVSRFLASARELGTVTNVQDALFCNEVVLPPSELPNISNSELIDISRHSICITALSGTLGAPTVVHGHPRLSVTHTQLSVIADVEIIEAGEGAAENPTAINSQILSIRSADHFLPAMSADLLWRNADSCLDIEIAIALEAVKIGRLPDLKAVPTFRVGSEFLKSLQAVQASGEGTFASVTLQKCALLLVNAAQLGPQPFRSGRNAASSPRTRARDKAAAMRAHITGEHEALRLMYWVLPDKSVEFSCVRGKHDLNIDEGSVLPLRGW